MSGRTKIYAVSKVVLRITIMRTTILYSVYASLLVLGWLTVGFAEAAEPRNGKEVLVRVPELKAFFAAKERQARADLKDAGEDAPPEVWSYFEAARNGNWSEAARLWQVIRNLGDDTKPGSKPCQSKAGSPLIETELALGAFREGEPKYPVAYGQGIVQSIPAGAIFFGGTDPGRGLPTLFSKSHVEGDPFFTLTQNALADGTYLEYLRRMYGKKISIPTTTDSQNAFQEYMDDAQRRLKHDQTSYNEPKQIKPGEDVRLVDGKVQVSGQVAVMAINGLLAKMIFDKNAEREFYVEESFPLDWMYPHLSPHGWVMKINRQPLKTIPAEAVQKDREFWGGQTKKLLGEGIGEGLSVKELCGFVEKVYADRNLEQFKGDPKYVTDPWAPKAYSKLRSSIAGVYAWRMQNTKGSEEREAMRKEAEFAFRQAFALCPQSPEAVYRYVNLLVGTGRGEDALEITKVASKVEPQNGQFKSLQKELERITRKRER